MPVRSGVENNVAVRFFPGNWYTIDPDTKVENLASRQDLMMALQDINQILIRFVTLVNNKQTTSRANFNLLLAGGVLITFVSGLVRLYSHLECQFGMTFDMFCYFAHRIQYFPDGLETNITDINIDSAAHRNNGQSKAAYVEQCTCPTGYSGLSCEVILPNKSIFTH